MHYHRHKCNTHGSCRLIPVLESPSGKQHLQFYYHIRESLCECLTVILGDRARRISIQEVEGCKLSQYVIVVQVEEEGTPEWWDWLEFEVWRMVICNRVYEGRCDWGFAIRFWPIDHAAAMKATSRGIPEWMKVAAGPDMSPPPVQQSVPMRGFFAHEPPPQYDVPMGGSFAYEPPPPQQLPFMQTQYGVPMGVSFAYEPPPPQQFPFMQPQYGVPMGGLFPYELPPPQQFPVLQPQYSVPMGGYIAHESQPPQQFPLLQPQYGVLDDNADTDLDLFFDFSSAKL